ncbi:hypothetical protein KUTeg_024208 [Tegillarca granosa]|uniref:Uncharacterized protein n=1 Tax=Tegillarca granosa TaxID=220873 RepID=A0ABQ9E197_TEGGR|nr:hypothetical protein KUTeg_024208 [Tegillarca granosa]
MIFISITSFDTKSTNCRTFLIKMSCDIEFTNHKLFMKYYGLKNKPITDRCLGCKCQNLNITNMESNTA